MKTYQVFSDLKSKAFPGDINSNKWKSNRSHHSYQWGDKTEWMVISFFVSSGRPRRQPLRWDQKTTGNHRLGLTLELQKTGLGKQGGSTCKRQNWALKIWGCLCLQSLSSETPTACSPAGKWTTVKSYQIIRGLVYIPIKVMRLSHQQKWPEGE